MTHLEIEQIDGTPIVHLKEDLDVGNAAAVERKLADAVGPKVLSLIVDLSRVEYLDSAAIDMLLRFADRLEHRRNKLILVVPESSQLRRLLTILGLPEAIGVHPSVDAALSAQRSAGPS